MRNPRVFMFDEPLSLWTPNCAMDYVCTLPATASGAENHTMVYVTRPDRSGITARKIVVMNYGELSRWAPRWISITNRQISLSPGLSVLEDELSATVGSWQRGKLTVRLSQQKSLTLACHTPLQPGSQVTLGIRPEHLTTDLHRGTQMQDLTVKWWATGNNTYLFTGNAMAMTT